MGTDKSRRFSHALKEPYSIELEDRYNGDDRRVIHMFTCWIFCTALELEYGYCIALQ